MTTIDLLIAHFGSSPSIPFEQGAGYLQYHPETLPQKINSGTIRLRYFSLKTKAQTAAEAKRLKSIFRSSKWPSSSMRKSPLREMSLRPSGRN